MVSLVIIRKKSVTVVVGSIMMLIDMKLNIDALFQWFAR